MKREHIWLYTLDMDLGVSWTGVCVWGVMEALICSWVATFRWAISPFLLVSFESL